MWKKIAKILSMGSLAGLIIAKLRGIRINPPALRLLLAILVVMAFFVDSLTVVMLAGTWLIFLLATDVARLAGVNLSLFLPAEKKKVEKDNDTQFFRLPRVKNTEEPKNVELAMPAPEPVVSEAKESGICGIFSRFIRTEKKVKPKAKQEVLEADIVEPEMKATEASPFSFIPEWMRVDKMIVSALSGLGKKKTSDSEDLALFRKD